MSKTLNNMIKDMIKNMIKDKNCYMCKYYTPNDTPNDTYKYNKNYDGKCKHSKIDSYQPYAWWKSEYHGKTGPELTKCKGKYFSKGGDLYNLYKLYFESH